MLTYSAGRIFRIFQIGSAAIIHPEEVVFPRYDPDSHH
jgi:hypothetical protein